MAAEEVDGGILAPAARLRVQMRCPLQITAKGTAISVLVREQDGAIATPPRNEDEQEIVEIDTAIQAYLDEIAVLMETYCEECPRTQERVTQEYLIERRKLRIVALKWRRKELVQEVKSSQKRRGK